MSSFPARLDGVPDERLSRGLWLVKWLLLIPHAICLWLLWIAFAVCTVIAFFAILVTGRYPAGLFDFNLGVLRWTWRVAFYGYGALGTDRYPPFSLGEEPDYPARLDVDRPERLSRGLVLVKSWLLAIPHLLVVGVFAGGLTWWIGDEPDWVWRGGVIQLLALAGGLVLLFTGAFPRGLHDILLGMDRWVLRVAAYVGLMTDVYPPFRLDLGPHDHPAAPVAPAAPDLAPERPAGAPPPPHTTSPARTAMLIGGSLALLVAIVLAVGGVATGVVDRTQRDDDGFVMSPSTRVDTASYALVSEDVELDLDDDAALELADLVGTVRVRVRGDRPVFVGIARSAEVRAWLAGTAHEVVRELGDAGDPSDRTRVPGGALRVAPADAGIWRASAETTGSAPATLDVDVEGGTWSLVVANADGTAGVDARVAAGAELGDLGWIALGLLVAALLVGGAGTVLVVLGARRP